MVLSEIQFNALAELRKKRTGSKTLLATKAVFVEGLTVKDAAGRHGIAISTLSKSVWNYRKSLALTITVISGQTTKAPSRTVGHTTVSSEPLYGLEVLGDSEASN